LFNSSGSLCVAVGLEPRLPSNSVFACSLISFFHTLKVELIDGNTYNTLQEAKMAILGYIEGFYNRKRRHSYLGYLSPTDFEKKNAA
jgi:hypothetical protein